MPYAQGTDVGVGRSQDELRQTLKKYGADGFAIAETNDVGIIEFTAHDRRIRFRVPMPSADDRKISHSAQGQRRQGVSLKNALEKETKRRWRALVLIVKAKLEAAESGIVTFEDEFLAQTVLPDNSTVGEQVQPGITRAYVEGHVRPLLALEG